MAGDYILNLLKVNELGTHSDFLDLLMSYNLYRQITLPTRFSKFNATLIDNFFCKLKHSGQQNIAGILIRTFSSHQPYFIFVNKPQNREQIPKFAQIKINSAASMLKVKNEIVLSKLYDKLNKSPTADTNINYDIIHKAVTNSIKKAHAHKNS